MPKVERAGKSLGLGGVDELLALYAQDTALARNVTVDEVAALVVFLASEAGGGITGTNLSIDAGTSPY